MQKLKLPKGWRKVKLREVADFQNGYAFSSREFVSKRAGALPVFKMGNIKEGGGIQWTMKEDYIPLEKAKKLSNFITEPGDILMCMTDMKANVRLLGYCAYIKNEKFLINQRVGRIKARKRIVDSRFLYFYLNSPDYINYIRSTARSGVQVNLSTEEIKKSPLILPPIEEQKRIAEILSAFDEKIELNDKINQILEEMAQAIFKEWFVKFRFPGWKKVEFVDSELGKIPEGWRVKKLGEISVIKYGKGPSTRKLKEKGEYPVYGANGVIGYYEKYDFEEPQIIVGCRGVVANVSKTLPKSSVTHNSFVIILGNSCFKNYLYYFLKISDLSSIVTGSAQPQITIRDLSKFLILLPSRRMIKAFEIIVKTLEEKRLNTFFENQKLSALRDLLLPKLMSGEVRV